MYKLNLLPIKTLALSIRNTETLGQAKHISIVSIFVFVKKNRLNEMKSNKHYAKIQNYKYINETKLKNHLHIYVTCM